ncbi:hypothetical protein [Paenibacillus xylanivorans]|uniref:Uncharacterized protein n=1 Tax=Paenibacillus xylanivorans TaxID=1705561 RepID=A0A0M9BN65_9BACL|nr:hypothetical protein [Paenibacillus xylanivorans]KOY15750.1 hypothetical protein AMS66_13795 [Paenibacillus xylanivorans]
MYKDINIQIDGLGIIVYSPFSVAHINEEEDYLTQNYMSAQQVADHVNRGTIVGFSTGSPGDYNLRIRTGYPDEKILDESDFVLRLGLEVRNHELCIRDLYDLMEWTSELPGEQVIRLDNGYYHITVFSNLPDSKIRGDQQEIYLYFNQLTEMPKIMYSGVPTFE